MGQERICCPHSTDAIHYAAKYLCACGFDVTPSPDMDITHLLLPVPTFPAAEVFLSDTLSILPPNVQISGGNLEERLNRYQVVDFLKDPYYLAENAAITARCAIEIVERRHSASLSGCSILIVGWGRIGKCLSYFLGRIGATVTVAARKDADRAMIRALGFQDTSIADAASQLKKYQVILNTVPVMVLPDMATRPDTIILELASKPGMSGANIIDARGLPSKMAPEASGKLIAETFIRLSLGKEV